MKKHKTFKNRKGFTVIELVVAIAVFSVAMSLIVGAFIQALKAQRMTNSLMGLNSNASLIFEQMAREIRTGYNFDLTDNSNVCGNDGATSRFNSLEFTRPRGNGTTTVAYRWNGTTNAIDRREGDGIFAPLTSRDIDVRFLCFAETENSVSIVSPWRITIFMTLGSREAQLSKNVLNLQTVVSARIWPAETQ
ncbi:MAG: type II secretion system protein [Patescibacteria group bacterium]|nr:type II secretion system protein [Patescibacteria group bacterium]